MDRDAQLMSEPNRVIDDKIPWDEAMAKHMVATSEEMTEALGNDYHPPVTIENFSIESINEYGQVTSSSLPEPTEERRGDYVTLKAEFEGMEGPQDLKIVCSGKAWYVVPPGLDVDYVLLAAKEVEEIQNPNG